jgi:hypothetical protein
MNDPTRMRPIARLRTLAPAALLALAACAGGAEPEVAAGPQAVASAAPALCLPAGATSADRMVTLHTQTMVAALGCGPFWGDGASFSRYARFVSDNDDLLSRSQAALAARVGGVSAFDRLHTQMSNAESMRMRKLGPAAYCASMKETFYAATAIDPEDLERQALFSEAASSAAPVCGVEDGA